MPDQDIFTGWEPPEGRVHARLYPFGAHVGLGEPDWPPVFQIGSAVIPALIGLIAVLQIHATYGIWWPAGVIAVTVLPWVIEAAWRPVPLLPFSVVVLAGVMFLGQYTTDVYVVPFLLVYLTAEVTARTKLRSGLALATAASMLMLVYEIVIGFEGSFIWVFGIWMGWGAGAMMQQLMLLTIQLKRAQAGLSEKAASDERQRIAREVHDVIAHSMTVTMLHVTGARLALQRDDAAEALEGLEDAERLGRQALADIRRTVGLLAPDGSATAPPMPKASDLRELVDGFVHAGLHVQLDVDGDLEKVPEAAGLAVYRIVQESIANAAKHAPGTPVSVAVAVGDGVTIRVHNALTNGAAPSAEGLGLKGMEQRATSLGGTFDAGPDDDGWTVTAALSSA